MKTKSGKVAKTEGLKVQVVGPPKKLASVARVVAEMMTLIRLEPTCIKCGCTWDNACEGGCSWTFLNKKTNEGLCSACFENLNVMAVRAANGR